MPPSEPPILVAMSGGVDSSVAALLLQRQGRAVMGAHMRLSGKTGAEADAEDARRVAEAIGIPFHVIDLRDSFEEKVIRPFVEAYRSGLTPNPCTICNREIKMGLLLEKARELGNKHVATGHFARIERNERTARWELHRGVDERKDQSYYLFGLDQEQLACFETPLGGRTKKEAERLAAEWNLPVSHRESSQDICFVSDGDYRSFIADHYPSATASSGGPIVDREGRELGRHDGIEHFTIGQRRGIGVAAPEPLYVVALRPEDRAVVVGGREEILSRRLHAGNVVWGAVDRLREPSRALVQIRYRSKAAPATIIPLDVISRVLVDFDEPQRAITPGQGAVFYDMANEKVLGGGWIECVPASDLV